MFSTLSERLQSTINALRGQARISESNIADSIREVRLALLEADVSLSVVKSFIDEVKQRALGQEVLKSLTPAQAFIDVVHQALVRLMGDAKQNLNLATTPPAVILLVGLQGTGKTTTSAKLAYWLKTQKKKVLLASADTYRPAAITQLQMLAKQVSVDCVDHATNATPPTIAIEALHQAQRGFYDVLIVDSAGRLAIDEKMMNEINVLHTTLRPIETLFVVDAMQGQDAVNTAKAFGDALPITGIVLTKLDGDARGGVALSVR
ncbi:MAG: signal recognition particle receptor subunit alpha, partial [Methylophilaceae bacterium]|nr:signal recognition particle receptor subunit alpha [Methylophilaceae bacterium]